MCLLRVLGFGLGPTKDVCVSMTLQTPGPGAIAEPSHRTRTAGAQRARLCGRGLLAEVEGEGGGLGWGELCCRPNTCRTQYTSMTLA